jgi:AcrR family transcriptional regulator
MDVRESLLKATVKVFSEAGARGATTRRIAQEAGVNEVTLFRHFKSKDELLESALKALADLVADKKLPDIPADPIAELTDWARDHHKQLHKYRALIRKTMGEFEENPSLCACTCHATIKMTSDLADYLKTLQLRGLANTTFNTHAAAAMLMGAMFADAVSRDAMPDRFPSPMKDAVDLTMPLYLAAIGVTTKKSSK